ncbi:hypothetical protein POM88_009398 [Heracleum sosnowskyi]|uniref:Uncharacterized protein n=1 Tax=Heracleum sosnowskyi TaxID=360622 RepID=A0AAD8JBN0_9APIA|nr:hypothetical protein POM88_009398 [Heracleum sosnowskyi]
MSSHRCFTEMMAVASQIERINVLRIIIVFAQVLSLVMDSDEEGLLTAYDSRYRPMVALVKMNFHKLRPSSILNYNEFKDISLLLPKFCQPHSISTWLQLYIYDHMKKRGLHDAADIFAKEANLEMLEWLSAAHLFEKGPLEYSPAQLLTTQITPVPPSGNASLQMPVTLLPPPQVAKRNDVSGERSVQVESTFSARQGSAYSPAAPKAGESYRKNQGLLSGVGVNEPDGPAHKSRLPPEFLEFMKQAVEWEMKRQCSNSSLNKS